MTPVIVLSGHRETGKDTVAKIIKKLVSNTEILAFSCEIKEIIGTLYPELKPNLYGSSELREKNVMLHHNQPINFTENVFCNKYHEIELLKWYQTQINHLSGTAISARTMLRSLGDWIRGRDIDWHVNKTFEKAKKLLTNSSNLVVITDGRYRNELLHSKKNGFALIRIKKVGGVAKAEDHSSEVEQDSIPDYWFDGVIHNDMVDMEDLESQVKTMLWRMGIKVS